MKTWFEILSELFVNIAAAWFAVVFIEPQINRQDSGEEILALIFRFSLGTISLFVAKYFRDKVRRRR